MSGIGPQEDVALRFAWAFAAAYLCLSLPARLANAAFWAGLAGVVATVAIFVLPVLYTIPRARSTWNRHRGWLLAGQTFLTFLPFAVFGADWVVGAPGLLAGLVLLTVRAPTSWVLFVGIVIAEGVRIALLGVPPEPGWPAMVLMIWPFTIAVNMGLALFGLVRLADLVSDLFTTRAALAAQAVTDQRLRAAVHLRGAIDDRLKAFTELAENAQVVLTSDPQRASVRLGEAAGVARQALADVREVGVGSEHNSPPSLPPSGGAVAPRLARLVLLGVLAAFFVALLNPMLARDRPVGAVIGAACAIGVVGVLQLYHAQAGHDRARPRGWTWTLAAQTVVGVGAMWVFDEATLVGLAGFAAGSALLLLPGWWAWAAFLATSASVGASIAIYSSADPDLVRGVAYLVALTAATGLMAYGLSRLTSLAHQVDSARRELAERAALQEQLRVARDTHDLLGLGLSAIALKCDLVVRLVERDKANAHRELEQVQALADQARSDAASVTSDTGGRLSLRTELEAARSTLATAEIELRAVVPAMELPHTVDAVLATVLREAVTNIIRHTAATRCTVQLSVTGSDLRLHVANDGALLDDSPESPSAGGAGLSNLHARVRAVGGDLSAVRTGDGWFELTVDLPASREL